MKIFKSGEKGFTLIELLVVISILGVLAAVVVLNVTKFIGSGRTEAKATELSNIQTAVSAFMYESSSHAAPANTAALAPYLLSTPHGTYTIDSTGKVTQSTYP